MLYNFHDINKVAELNVVIIYSKHAVFENYAVDIAKKDISDEIERKLGVNEESIGNNVDFGEFMQNISVPFMFGRWYCDVLYKELKKSDRDKLFNYIKNSSKNGRLVMRLSEYKEYMELARMVCIKNNENVGLFNMSFPSKQDLVNYIKYKASDLRWTDDGIREFILRIADKYNDYNSCFDRVRLMKSNIVNKKIVKEALVGMENYMYDTLLLNVLRMKKKRGLSKTYRIYKSIKEETSAINILRRIESDIDKIVIARILLDDGYVPGTMAYNAGQCIERINKSETGICKEDLEKLTSKEYTFKKYVRIATMVTLRDAVMMQEIIRRARVQSKFMTETDAERCIYILICRGELSDKSVQNLFIEKESKEIRTINNNLIYGDI